MGAFVRRFSQDPDEATLLAIEGVVVIDSPPTSTVRGTGTGTVCCVGETEDGAFAVDSGAVEVFGSPDLTTKFGGFGFTYAGIPYQNPCCRSRKADSATDPEFWNGSAFVQLRSCRFSRLFIARVDSSVGAVSFNRLASLAGATSPSWNLEPAQTLVLSIDGAGNVTVTWDAAVATILSADGTYDSTFAGGETITFKIDGTTYVATFTSADQSHVQVVARMNEAAGYTAFVASTLKTRINGQIRGTSGNVQIVAVSEALVTTATGFTPSTAVAGTGDVGNIDLVTDAEFIARVEADTSSAASGDRDSSGRLRVFSLTTDGTGSILVDSTSTATAFGFTTEVTATAAAGVKGTIPAGTRVQASGSGQLFVTMQTVNVTAANPGPYSVKVRHADDDQTGDAEIADAVDTVYAPIQLGAFAVTNPLPVTAALTDAQLDARYASAIDKTRGIANPVREVNIIVSARQSNSVRAALKQNAIDASAQGCFGRVAFIRPPLGTTRAVAEGDAQPGVGAYRSDTVGYAFPGVQKRVPEIQSVGTSGGVGFTDDGVVNAGWDFGRASLCSNLNPEENVGQETTGIVDWVLGIESGNADVADLTLEDYEAFKRVGIGAPRIDGTVTLQSDVTTVDPALYPALAPMNRRRFAYFYQDSVAQFARPFVKKLATRERRALLVSRFNTFISQLKGEPSGVQRIEDGLVDGSLKAGNTPESVARNVFITVHQIRMLPTLDVIVLKTEVGTDVTITEL